MTFVALCTAKGTVFQSVIDAMRDGSLTATCAGLVSDSPDRGCVQKAKDEGIPVRIVPMNKDEKREDFDRRVDKAIHDLCPPSPLGGGVGPAHRSFSEGGGGGSGAGDTPIIACMGWMWMFSPWFVGTWKNRILNVHPSLLPKHPGSHAHALVLASGDSESGMTMHLIDEGMDTGKILLQKTCPVLPNDTVDTLKARVQALECEWYPKVLGAIEQGNMTL